MRKIVVFIFIVGITTLFAEEQGFTYRGGVDFTPKYYQIPSVSYSFGIGLGCEGFDLEASFRSLLSGEAIKNYLEGNLRAIISAAPMLLLEYASPTLADTLKHLQNRSGELLHLNYLTCQDVMERGQNWLAKLRGENQAMTIQTSSRTSDLATTMENVKNDTSLKNILNYQGKPISNGNLYVVKDGLEWTKAPQETKDIANELLGDVVISGSGKISYVESKKTPNELYTHNRNEFEKNIKLAIDYYLATGKVNQQDLKKISLPAFPIREVVIKSIGDLKQGKREIAIGKLASTLAHIKMLTELDDLHYSLSKAHQNPHISETTKEILQQKITLTENIKKNLKLEKETTEEYFAKTINTIISEAEVDKAKAFNSVISESKKEASPSENKFNWGGIAW
ncbi:MAG: hypothetical protein QXV73_04325 [Candidatus Micrarchaeia archaeon]